MFVSLTITLIVDPVDGLFIFWRMLVPLLPLLFLTSLGLWRNICPVSAANQFPRVFGFSGALEPPRSIRERGYLVGIALLAAIIPTRRVVFDHEAGYGRPVRRRPGFGLHRRPAVQGQERMVQQHLSDAADRAAVRPDSVRARAQQPLRAMRRVRQALLRRRPHSRLPQRLLDGDHWWRLPRRSFAGAFPGVIVAFFKAPAAAAASTYMAFGAAALVSLLVFVVIGRWVPRLHAVQPAI